MTCPILVKTIIDFLQDLYLSGSEDLREIVCRQETIDILISTVFPYLIQAIAVHPKDELKVLGEKVSDAKESGLSLLEA